MGQFAEAKSLPNEYAFPHDPSFERVDTQRLVELSRPFEFLILEFFPRSQYSFLLKFIPAGWSLNLKNYNTQEKNNIRKTIDFTFLNKYFAFIW